MLWQEGLRPLDIAQLMLEDVDSVSNDVLRDALESVRRRQGTEILNHQSHKSHGSKIGTDEPMETLKK
jgi:hypothetical protein